MIALPVHHPCGADGCGELDAQNVATCVTRRKFVVRAHDEPGCGARFALNKYGLRDQISAISESLRVA